MIAQPYELWGAIASVASDGPAEFDGVGRVIGWQSREPNSEAVWTSPVIAIELPGGQVDLFMQTDEALFLGSTREEATRLAKNWAAELSAHNARVRGPGS